MRFLLLLIGVATLAAAATSSDRPWLPCGIPIGMHLFTSISSSNSSLDGNLGASELFDNPENGPQRWPRNAKNQVIISYCYDYPGSRVKLRQAIDMAIQSWYDDLGGKASKESGHGVVFQETLDQNGFPLFCLDKADDRDRWNPRVSINTLPVEYWGENMGYAASIGFQTANPPKPWVMHMHLENKGYLTAAKHELGHVMGMAHEHQRRDRDIYVRYNCENLRFFQSKLQQAQRDYPGITPAEFCTELLVMMRYSFRGFDYLKETMSRQTWTVKESGPYDLDSIMHYDTGMDGTPECNQGDLSACALVVWDDPNQQVAGHWKWKDNNGEPSKGDVDWVRKTYPWQAPP